MSKPFQFVHVLLCSVLKPPSLGVGLAMASAKQPTRPCAGTRVEESIMRIGIVELATVNAHSDLNTTKKTVMHDW